MTELAVLGVPAPVVRALQQRSPPIITGAAAVCVRVAPWLDLMAAPPQWSNCWQWQTPPLVGVVSLG